jgi:putative DNA primase/helicase
MPIESSEKCSSTAGTKAGMIRIERLQPVTPIVPEGIDPDAWARLASAHGGDWHIRERNAAGEVVGTSIRKANGSKTMKSGSKRGLIVAWPLLGYAGTSLRTPILVCEGASDTASALTLGFDAVGVPMAGQCGESVAELLRDRHGVIVADGDEPGRRGADKIAAALLGSAASVRIIDPPHGAKDLRAGVIAGATREMVDALIDDAERIEPPPRDGEPVLVCMGDVQPETVRWLWHGRLPLGRLSLLVGRPGEGKSFATIDWAARVSTGSDWPDGLACECGSVLLVSAEDDPGDTIRPRLDAHGADASRVHLLSAVNRRGENGRLVEAVFTLADLDPLRQSVERIGDVRLIVIDPIGSYIGGRIDAHRDNEVRSVLAPLAALAQQCGAAVVLVAHQRKAAATHADDLVLGSRAFTGIARSVLHLIRDPENDDRRLLLPGKTNLSMPAPGLAFAIRGEPTRLEWEPGTVNLSASEVLAAGKGGAGSAKYGAAEWLRDELSNGPVPSKELQERAKADGIAWKTVRSVKDLVGAHPTRKGFGPKGRWVWVNSAGSPKKPIDVPNSTSGIYGALCNNEPHNGEAADGKGTL